jgi:hypothetical protein
VYTITRGGWLDYFGFQASPFESQTAAQEDPTMWVPPPNFERILGDAHKPQSILVFAPRGGGKTVCRRLVEYYCSPDIGVGASSEVGGRVLAVPYTNFEEAAAFLKKGEQVDITLHIEQILKRISQQLLNYINRNQEIKIQLQNSAEGLALARRQELFSLLEIYLPRWTKQYEELHMLFPELKTNALRPLRDLRLMTHLELFISLLCSNKNQGLNFDAIYILIDSLDQSYETADLNQNSVLELILPLIANRQLMYDIEEMAIKCFIPEEVRRRLLGNPVMRGMGLPEVEIRWHEHHIGEILKRRLQCYKKDRKDGSFTRIETLCMPELRDLEKKLFKLTEGNPRHILRVCDFMVEAHLQRPTRYISGSSNK